MPDKGYQSLQECRLWCMALVICALGLGLTAAAVCRGRAMADNLYDISVLDQVPLDPQVASSAHIS